MRWCVIRHPDLGEAVVAEPSLTVHRPRGWVRVSPWSTDRDALRPADHPGLVDLDADPDQADQQPADTNPDAERPTPAPEPKATARKREN
ncbi:hypothetical protein [Micromonospora zhanjiangensis]